MIDEMHVLNTLVLGSLSPFFLVRSLQVVDGSIQLRLVLCVK